MKKTGYKHQIEQELLNQDFEIIEIGSSKYWWDIEHWKIQLKYNPEISFYICFIVDPLIEKSKEIGRILAKTEFPNNWNDYENEIASIEMSKMKFDLKLNAFIDMIEDFKKAKK